MNHDFMTTSKVRGRTSKCLRCMLETFVPESTAACIMSNSPTKPSWRRPGGEWTNVEDLTIPDCY